MSKALRFAAHSEIGLVRKNNQDSGYASPTMLMVADGMGGAAAGDLASAVAINELKATDGDFADRNMIEVVAGAIARANEQIADIVRADPSLDGMGTTICGVLFDGESCALANIGDSRGYRMRGGAMKRVTRDHSWVQSLVDDGRITEAEALVHPHRSLILRVLNGHPSNLPDLDTLDVEVGDRLLFCSDGLCGLVTDAAIQKVLATPDRDEVMRELIRLAHDEGGLDNITIIIADVVEGEPEGEPQILGAAADLARVIGTEDTAVLRAEESAGLPARDSTKAERIRYAPTDRRGPGAWVKVVLWVLVPVLMLGGGGYGWYAYTQTKLYVGAADEAVAIYRGVPDRILGVALSSVIEKEPTQINDLPPFYRERVLGNISVPDMTVARTTVAELDVLAQKCIEQRKARATMTATPSPSATGGAPSESPRATPTSGPTPKVTPTTMSPSATPTPTTGAPEDC